MKRDACPPLIWIGSVHNPLIAGLTDLYVELHPLQSSSFEAFGATLIPILTAAGVEINDPMVARVHNEIKA